MRPRLIVCSILAVLLILVAATPALANSLASWVWIWPGVVSIEPFFGLLPTVLVSFIERPFVTRAGIDKRPLLRSIQANLLSLLAGIPVAVFVWASDSMQGLALLAVVAVAVTIVVEIAYFRSVMRRDQRQLRWSWIVYGNIVSNLVLVGIALTVRKLGENYPNVGTVLEPYQGPLMVMHVAISLTAVTAAIIEPIMPTKHRDIIVGQIAQDIAPANPGN
jgi:hypothetical protein